MSSETKRGEGAAEELGQEKGEEEAQGVKKDAAEVADKAKEKLGEAAGDAKKAVHSFMAARSSPVMARRRAGMSSRSRPRHRRR